MEMTTIESMLKGLQADKAFAAARILDQDGKAQQTLGTAPTDAIMTTAVITFDNQAIGKLELTYTKELLRQEIRRLTVAVER